MRLLSGDDCAALASATLTSHSQPLVGLLYQSHSGRDVADCRPCEGRAHTVEELTQLISSTYPRYEVSHSSGLGFSTPQPCPTFGRFDILPEIYIHWAMSPENGPYG